MRNIRYKAVTASLLYRRDSPYSESASVQRNPRTSVSGGCVKKAARNELLQTASLGRGDAIRLTASLRACNATRELPLAAVA